MDTVITTVVLVAVGFLFGRMAEQRHYRSIIEREQEFLNLPTTSSKTPVTISTPQIATANLVTGHVVISIDYFKWFVANLRNIFGGTVQAYETLLDRARREAVLRLKANCPGADEIINLRIETSSISKGQSERVGCVEALAYGTAIYRHASPSAHP